MANHDPAIQWVFPSDSIDTVIDKVCHAGASPVQLLVPEGVPLLQSDLMYDALRRSLLAHQIDLLVISSDEKTLATARKFDFETILVKDATIVLPFSSPSPSPEPAAVPAPVREPVARPVVAPRDEPDDLDPFAELDSLSDVLMGVSPGPQGDGVVRPEAPTEPRRRIRPEDIVLSDEEISQASSIRSGGGRAPGGRKKTKPSAKKPVKKVSEAPEGLPEEHRLTISLPLPARTFVLVLLVILMLFGMIMFWLGRVTVSVAPPAPTSQIIRFTNQPVLIAQSGAIGSDIAVQAEIISAHREVSRTGQVGQETLSPGVPAHGTITLLNESGQSFSLPAGTEFIGTNRQGQTVRFTSDTTVVVPGMSSIRQGIQIITTLGSAQVPITARVAGQLSNIEANTITHMIIPGQPQIPITGGPLFVEHGAIGGGEETLIRIVKREDVYPVLSAALTDLYNQALSQLEATASNQGLVLDAETMFPGPEDLSSETGTGYDAVVFPPIGQTLEGSDTFLVQVRANFSALATPAGVPPLSEQLRGVLPNQLVTSGVVSPGMALEPVIEKWDWDGSRLTVSGVMQPANPEIGLDAQTLRLIRSTIKGKTYGAATHELEQLKQQGFISGYMLPQMREQERLPEWDIQITIKVLPYNRLPTHERT